MKILMLVNWRIKYCDVAPTEKQPMDYYVRGEDYWFYQYFKEKPEVDVIDTHSFPWLENFEKEKLRFYIIQALRVIPKLNQYDLIVSHGMQSGVVISMWRRLIKSKAKHIVFDIGSFNSGAESGFALRMMQAASKSIDALIYHTKWQHTYYEKYYPWIVDKSFYVPFGIDVNTLKHEKRDKETREQYILCIGKSRCDWDTVIQAYKGIDTDVILRFIGGFDEKYSSEKNVEMLGYMKFFDLLNQIDHALFCILPIENVHFSFGQIRFLQQMAMGKCVLAPKAYSLVDYGTNLKTCMFYEPKDVESCRKMITRAIQDENLRRQIEKAASRDVADNYTEINMAEEVEKILLKIIG